MYDFISCWLNHPISKNMSQIGSFPCKDPVENKQYLNCKHLRIMRHVPALISEIFGEKKIKKAAKPHDSFTPTRLGGVKNRDMEIAPYKWPAERNWVGYLGVIKSPGTWRFHRKRPILLGGFHNSMEKFIGIPLDNSMET